MLLLGLSAKLVGQVSANVPDATEASHLRRQAAAFIEDEHSRYVGKRVSRKWLDETGNTEPCWEKITLCMAWSDILTVIVF